MTPEAKGLWERAMQSLSAAKKMSSEFPDIAASRAYYAAFYAVSAHFAIEGRFFAKHSAVESGLHGELIKTGRLPDEIGRLYSYLREMRETGDYGTTEHVLDEQSEKAVEAADAVIKAIKNIRPEFR